MIKLELGLLILYLSSETSEESMLNLSDETSKPLKSKLIFNSEFE